MYTLIPYTSLYLLSLSVWIRLEGVLLWRYYIPDLERRLSLRYDNLTIIWVYFRYGYLLWFIYLVFIYQRHFLYVISSCCAMSDIRVFLIHLWLTCLCLNHWWLPKGYQMEGQVFTSRRSLKVQEKDRCFNLRRCHMDTLRGLYSASKLWWHCLIFGLSTMESSGDKYLPERCLCPFGYVKSIP